MELTAGRLACIVVVFCLGYYFGRRSRRPAAAAPAATLRVRRQRDPADWWKTGRPPPH